MQRAQPQSTPAGIGRFTPTRARPAAGSAASLASENARPRLTVVVPVHDESGCIAGLLREIGAALGVRSHEIVVVDDGSTDDTVSNVECERQAGRPGLRLVSLDRHRGQSAAIRAGVHAARGEWIVTIDGDGQNDPADIPRMLDARRNHVHRGDRVLIYGVRRSRRDTLVRRVSSRLANRVRGRLLADGCFDTACGLKLFRRDDFLLLPAFDHMHRFLPALMQREGVVTVGLDVDHRPRATGSSKYGINDRLWAGLVDLAGVLWLRRRAIPLPGDAAGRTREHR